MRPARQGPFGELACRPDLDENGDVYDWGEGYTATPQKLEINKKVIGISGNLILTEDKKVYQQLQESKPT